VAWHGADVLRDLKRMRREHERGEETFLGGAAIEAAIDLMEAHRAIDWLDSRGTDPSQPDREAYAKARDELVAVMPEKQRRLASLMRQRGIEDWATFLPSFDATFGDDDGIAPAQ
jgi:hypothetical protein